MKEVILKAIKNTGSTQQKKQAFHEIPKIMSELHIDLTNNQYQTGIFSCFVVRDPKLREIFAPSYRDRIVHHLIIDHIAPHIDKTFLSSSCANRKGKGVLFGVKQVQKYAKNPNNTYFLQMDIKNFFPSINKHILWELLQTHIQKIEKIGKNRKEFYLTTLKKIVFQDLLKPYVIYTEDKTLLEKIPKEKSLFHRPKHLGLPIGSLTSQFFANIYLNELDRFIKHTLRAKNYVRYVDDFMILSSDKNVQKKTLFF